MSIIYMGFTISLLLDVVAYIQVLLDASHIFMGITILAISNTCIDMFVNGSLSAQGFEIMAVTGLLGGQMFNFVCGFSLSCLVKSFGSNSEKKFNLFNWDDVIHGKDKTKRIAFLVLSFSFVTLVTLLLSFTLSK